VQAAPAALLGDIEAPPGAHRPPTQWARRAGFWKARRAHVGRLPPEPGLRYPPVAASGPPRSAAKSACVQGHLARFNI